MPQTKLLPFFSNLLPEGHLRAYLTAKARVKAERDFPLLWVLSEDLPGAVVAKHRHGNATPPHDADLSAAAEAESNPTILRFSLAGVQLKFSAVLEADGELTIPIRGVNGRWILNMPSPTYKYSAPGPRPAPHLRCPALRRPRNRQRRSARRFGPALQRARRIAGLDGL